MVSFSKEKIIKQICPFVSLNVITEKGNANSGIRSANNFKLQSLWHVINMNRISIVFGEEFGNLLHIEEQV